MKIFTGDFSVSTSKRNEMLNITSQVCSVVSESGISDGDVIVFCPHTTAAITINENADPDVVHDILLSFSELLPQDRRGYRHCEGNSDAHCKSSIFGCSEQVILCGKKLSLGTWQGIYFCEFDGPRTRRVTVQVRGN